MAQEKIARLSSAEVSFIPKGETEAIVLSYQQSVTLTKSVTKKEVISNDTSIDETVIEVDTKTDYEFNTDIGDLKLDNLALAFKGVVETVTYEAGDIFPTGKTVRANDQAAGIGELILNDDGTLIHIAIEEMGANGFTVAKCAAKTYKATTKKIKPEARKNNFGKIICDGVNEITGDNQILVIPSINLSFDGSFQVSGNEVAKLSLKGKCLKADDLDIFELYDA